MAALEAMSCGLPVVASNIGGLHEVVEDGDTGFLFDPHDAQGMSSMITELCRDDARRKGIGLKARERAKRDFGKDKIIDEYVEFYEEVV